MLSLSSTVEAAAAVARARCVTAYAYTLRPGRVERALETAARSGARVVVRLEAHPFGGARRLARNNLRIVERLRAAGADAALEAHVHVKALEAGGALFLDGRNWGDGDFVVRDDDRSDLAATKHEALAKEAALLRAASHGDRVLVESESFGSGNPVYRALDELARRGDAPRLMVGARVLATSRRERALLEHLRHDGVDVRVCADSEKFAVTGREAWAGSANATFDRGAADMWDWGARTTRAGIVRTIRARLESRWKTAGPLRAPKASKGASDRAPQLALVSL